MIASKVTKEKYFEWLVDSLAYLEKNDQMHLNNSTHLGFAVMAALDGKLLLSGNWISKMPRT